MSRRRPSQGHDRLVDADGRDEGVTAAWYDSGMTAKAWKGFLAPAIVLAIVYGLLPVALWKEPIYDALVSSAVVAIFIGIRRYRPARASRWMPILLAMGCIGAAEWVWFANDVRGISPYPSWGEVLDLLGRAVLLYALARLSASRGQLRDRTAVVDAVVIGVAAAALVSTFVFGSYFGRNDVDAAARLITAGYLLFDTCLIVGFVLLLFEARRGAPALRLLAIGVGVLVVGDVIWLGLLSHNQYVIGHLLDSVWPIAYCFIAAAALHPTMTSLADADAVARPHGRTRLVILPCAVIALPAASLVADILNISLSLVDNLIVGFATLVIGLLVATRFLAFMRFVENVADARGAHRTEALVRESLDIIAVVGADGRVSYVSPPLERVLGWSSDRAIGERLDSVVLPEDKVLAADHFAAALASDFGTPHMFKLNVMAQTGRHVPMEISCVNRLDDPEINGVVVTARDISERDRLEREVAYQALHDRTTGLANRALLLDHIGLAVRQRRAECGAVFVLDLDDFKSINDALGHRAADELLVSVGERLRTCTRLGDTVARLGGDEFAVLLLNVDRADVGASAQRMLEVLRLPLCAGSTEIAVGASIGVRVLGSGDIPQLALRDADIAMYSAKWAGKARWQVYDPEMGALAARRVALMSDLRGAWQRGEIFVYYQPIVAAPSGNLRGAEALVRWSHPEFGRVSPQEFIPLAEETGIIRQLGLEVLREAARNAARWRAEFVPDFYVSVNVSPVQLDASLPEAVAEILAATGLDPCALVIEITENVVLSNVDASVRILGTLRESGVRIAIDDFGTGYSSLAYAQRFPVDLLKIDQSFTKKLDATHAGMIPTIIQLAQTMNAALVAEGVETLEQMTELVRLGCGLAQGYLYCPAVPQDSISDIVREGAMLVPGGAYAVAPTLLAVMR
jgi:diguanylate cyclase (GGDEF)-like protein/PAS domain S-box-containing protein